MDIQKPGDRVKALMEERNWSQTDLAYVLGVTSSTVNQVVNSKRPITPEMARLLEGAFDCSAEDLVELQARWSLQSVPKANPEIRSRAYVQTNYPVREMVKRGWIKDAEEGGEVYGELCRFFGVNTLDSVSNLSHAARKTGDREVTGEQLVWLYRVRAIAGEMPVPAYSPAKLQEVINRMSVMREWAEEIRHIPRLLQEAGVRFVVVEGLPGGKIDGVCTWLDNKSPVIGLSLRFDRIDNFWFVLRHECAHVLHGHGKSAAIIDSDLKFSDPDANDEEKIADAEAADFCVPKEKMNSFFVRKNPFFSDADIQAFAKINHVHPGLVVGQLQYLTGQFKLWRQHLVGVRKFVTSSAMTDGWGQSVTVG
jgi:HTH-type transcriptional regulator/antitoxin HigA